MNPIETDSNHDGLGDVEELGYYLLPIMEHMGMNERNGFILEPFTVENIQHGCAFYTRLLPRRRALIKAIGFRE